MAEHGRLSREEKKEIRKKRKELRHDLISRGITSKAEFETLAQYMGLVYGTRKITAVAWFWKIMNFIGRAGIISVLATAGAAIGLAYVYSDLVNKKQDFTISVSGSLQKVGLDLSETEDFSNPSVRLQCNVLDEVTCISLKTLPNSDILDKNASGDHSEPRKYFAYTFWVRNAGEKEVDYTWELKLKQIENDVDKALWVMLYDEGKQTIYSKEISEDNPEHLSGFDKEYFKGEAANAEYQYYNSNGKYGIRTTKYENNDLGIIAKGKVENFNIEDKHKYTVVMWLEGDDPDCTNAILGGNAICDFNITVEDESEAFDDLIYDKETYDKEAQEGMTELQNNTNNSKDSE